VKDILEKKQIQSRIWDTANKTFCHAKSTLAQQGKRTRTRKILNKNLNQWFGAGNTRLSAGVLNPRASGRRQAQSYSGLAVLLQYHPSHSMLGLGNFGGRCQ
jgi:hypothetical protein